MASLLPTHHRTRICGQWKSHISRIFLEQHNKNLQGMITSVAGHSLSLNRPFAPDDATENLGMLVKTSGKISSMPW